MNAIKGKYPQLQDISSNVNEGIRAILNLFIFFYKKISHAQKAQKAQKAQNANKRLSSS